jgi:hypothetical protein
MIVKYSGGGTCLTATLSKYDLERLRKITKNVRLFGLWAEICTEPHSKSEQTISLWSYVGGFREIAVPRIMF